MDDEKQIILQMLADGKIDAKKAAELIEALDEPAAEQAAAPAADPAPQPGPVAASATERPASPTPGGNERPGATVEDMGRELADRIENIVTQSVGRSTEIASRVADSAVRGAMAFSGRFSAQRIEQKIRRRTEKAVAHLARIGRRHERHGQDASSSRFEQESGLAEWRANLHKAFEMAASSGYEDVSDLLEEIVDLSADFTSELGDITRYAVEAREAGNLSDAMEHLDEVIEHVTEALQSAHEIGGHLSGLMGTVEFARVPGLRETAHVLVSTWPSLTEKLNSIRASAMAARSKALAAVKEAIAEIGLVG